MARNELQTGIRWLYFLEAPLVYGLTIFTSVVALVVWGVSKINSSSDGLLVVCQPWFGTHYGLIVSGLLVGLLVHNRRWKDLLAIAGAFLIMAVAGFGLSPQPISMSTDAYFQGSAHLSCLLVAIRIHFRQQADETLRNGKWSKRLG